MPLSAATPAVFQFGRRICHYEDGRRRLAKCRRFRSPEIGYRKQRKDLRRILSALAFVEHVKVGHPVFARQGVEEIVNLQPLPGSQAKPYQVKQVRQLITRYGLSIGKRP